MQNNLLSDRLLNFAADSIKLSNRFSKNPTGLHISNQFMRSSSSAGANYEEACGAESKKRFSFTKMQLVLKELRESIFWLKLSEKCGLIDMKELKIILQEVEEFVKIIAKSVITAKGLNKWIYTLRFTLFDFHFLI